MDSKHGRAAVALALMVLAAACALDEGERVNGETVVAPAGGGAGGGAAAGGSGNASVAGTTDPGDLGEGAVVPGTTDPRVCGEQDFAIEPAPVRVMILQDMSASMRGERWDQARQAMTTLLTDWQGRGLQFGFDRFSNPRSCDVTAPVVQDAQLDTETTIINQLNTAEPGGSTPLYCAMTNFTSASYAPNFLDSTEGSSYLLVISDGGDYCGTGCVAGSGVDDPVLPHLGSLTRQLLDDHGVKTYAIGFGDSFQDDELTEIVNNGGTGRTTYFDAADGPALRAVFEEIAQSVVSCVYDLDDTPGAERSNVNLYFDDEVVGLDEGCANGGGWRWTDNDLLQTVEFCPGACARLQDGVSRISATFGCPTALII